MKTYLKTLYYPTILLALTYIIPLQAGDGPLENQIIQDNVNQKDKNGQTPLHHATKEENVETIRSLISLGANIEAQDIDGKTALHAAMERGAIKSVKSPL